MLNFGNVTHHKGDNKKKGDTRNPCQQGIFSLPPLPPFFLYWIVMNSNKEVNVCVRTAYTKR